MTMNRLVRPVHCFPVPRPSLVLELGHWILVLDIGYSLENSKIHDPDFDSDSDSDDDPFSPRPSLVPEL